MPMPKRPERKTRYAGEDIAELERYADDMDRKVAELEARIADLEKGLRLVWYGPDDMSLEECGDFIEGLLPDDT